jgi:hypothetical protein
LIKLREENPHLGYQKLANIMEDRLKRSVSKTADYWWISNSICSKKNDVSDIQVFGIKMTGHTGLEEKSKKMINSLQGQSYRPKGCLILSTSGFHGFSSKKPENSLK